MINPKKILLELGRTLKILDLDPVVLRNILAQNPWFTEQSISYAFKNWSEALTEPNINQWLSPYDLNNTNPKKIGLILAGNIPLVGLHDVLCILISGHHALIKCSSKDQILLQIIAQEIIKIVPDWEERIKFLEDSRQPFDAIIATGSNNSARYFEYYFKDIPHIIRKNRTSVAILNGRESSEELDRLAIDIFSYFGLGCRNVSHLFLPKSFDARTLFESFRSFESLLVNHKKYLNNYDYSKSIYLMNRLDFLDNGFVLLKEDPALKAPLACLFYSYYDDLERLSRNVLENQNNIQCVVSNENVEGIKTVSFGQSQKPNLWDYADGIDTLAFCKFNTLD